MFPLLLACTPDEEPPPADGLTRIEWSGTLALEGTVEIAEDEAVFVQPGTVVELAPGAKLVIYGSLTAMGTNQERVDLGSAEIWEGIELYGTLQGNYLWLSGTGGALRVYGGSVTLTDSFVNLLDPAQSPDCVSASGGTVELDHVYLTGCRDVLLLEEGSEATVTGSSFAGEGVPVRLAHTDAVFTGNNFLGSPGMQDVGGGITAEVGGNCWDQEAPVIETEDLSQFTGLEDWAEAFFSEAGPR
jgi:hypothetical protein